MDVRIVVIHLAHLADVLPAGGSDQLIDRVVDVVRIGRDLRVGEVDSLLGGILYIGNIPRGVVDVRKVLQIAIGISCRLEIDQTKRQRIVKS